MRFLNFLFKLFLIILYVGMFCLHICLCMSMYIYLVFLETSYKLWTNLWILGIEPRSPGRTPNALNHWTTSSAPKGIFLMNAGEVSQVTHGPFAHCGLSLEDNGMAGISVWKITEWPSCLRCPVMQGWAWIAGSSFREKCGVSGFDWSGSCI